MEFVAVDVETANADCSSICQIGMALFGDDGLIDEWSALVNPEDYFDPFNVSIHGITESMVKDFHTFPALEGEIRGRIEGKIVLCHTAFDRVALDRVNAKYKLQRCECTWLDSARVARRTWSRFARSGYGLHNVCAAIGYEFRHHDALEDAKAAAHVLISAMNETGLDLAGWLKRVEQPISLAAIARPGIHEGPLFGEVLVFTGTLRMTRAEAAVLASKIGCTVAGGVTNETSILVVGDQDVARLAGYEKSSKHRKAESLIRQGRAIRILTENDFEDLVRLNARVSPSQASTEDNLGV